jgi:hypothetical protein
MRQPLPGVMYHPDTLTQCNPRRAGQRASAPGLPGRSLRPPSRWMTTAKTSMPICQGLYFTTEKPTHDAAEAHV